MKNKLSSFKRPFKIKSVTIATSKYAPRVVFRVQYWCQVSIPCFSIYKDIPDFVFLRQLLSKLMTSLVI